MTALLAWLGQPTATDNQPATLRFLDSAASKAYLATVAYALLAAIVEGVIRMVFWALAEHEKVVERHKDEGRAEGLAEGESIGSAKTAKEYEAKLAAAKERAKAEGIDLDKYLNP